jgi:hypothetical protein
MKQRIFNEAEVRASMNMLWLATMYARRTVATWNLRKDHRPTRQEMMNLASVLLDAENRIEKLALGSPTDGHSLDDMIDSFEIWMKEFDKEDE